MRIHITDLQVGDRLARDTFNSIGLNILSADTKVDEFDILKLNKHQIEYVDIEDRPLPGSQAHSQTAAASSELLRQEESFHSAIGGIKDLFESAVRTGKLSDPVVEQYYGPLISSVREEKDVVNLLLCLDSRDDYTYQHSVQVGLISYFISIWLGKSEEEAKEIGKAGYLHDIGKCRISFDVLHKPGKLTEEEYTEMRKHTVYGYEIIRNSIADELAALVALQHHERLNGSGYPLGKTSEAIHPAAKIVAVADVYSAMINNRSYQSKRDLLYVLKELHKMSFGELDPQAVHVFIANMVPNFIGKKATLSNGQSGTIVMTFPNDYFRPLIQIDDAGDTFVDLTQRTDLEIQFITV
ncbi:MULTISPECIES: HD-GYP domain-containing protein [unclassified Paenibacillus]|uniref:HD-GYP domain-containing protein n=1 Tax=unclassified Paenibacillus TaxID=185978 RepID=UPI00020D6E4D|nr:MULTISPECIES: HD-GYP domain-containing protein [unclassified Paenibacillus]EGL20044.1 HDIG domain protein [Paenibacillus sp. HGF7]